MKRIIICGGHLSPALALIDELLNHNKIEINFIGRKFSTEGSKNLSAEYQEIKARDIKFYKITTGRLQRKFTKHTIPSLLKIPVGFLQSLIYLAKIRPLLIVSFGSYISPPIVFAGWLLGIKSIAHESAIIPGLATKINSLLVDKIFLSWDQTQKYFTSQTEVIGNIVRKSVFKTQAKNSKVQKFLEKSKDLVYVTGGNQGSHFINKIIFQSLPLLSNFDIIHQIGTANFANDHLISNNIKSANYLPTPYISSEDIGAVFAKAKIIVGRSGANTVWELAILAKPSILIPLPIAASGEQEANAQILEKAGSAIIIEQKNVTDTNLLNTVKTIFKNYRKYQKNARIFARSLPTGANQKITDYIYQNYLKGE